MLARQVLVMKEDGILWHCNAQTPSVYSYPWAYTSSRKTLSMIVIPVQIDQNIPPADLMWHPGKIPSAQLT